MYEDLKEILCHELNEITRKGDIDREGLDDVYKLSSAITMVESLMKKGQQGEEGGYSQESRMMPMSWTSYEGGGSNEYSRMSNASNARGGGSNASNNYGNSRDGGMSNRSYNSNDYSEESSYRRGRDARTGQYVSRDGMSNESYDSYEGGSNARDSYARDSYARDSYARDGYSRHNAEQKVVQKLQDILATTQDTHIRKAIMQAMEKIDG